MSNKNKGGGGGQKPNTTGWSTTVAGSPQAVTKEGKTLKQAMIEAAVVGIVGVAAAGVTFAGTTLLNKAFGVEAEGGEMIPKAALDKQQAYIKQLKAKVAELEGDSGSDND